MTETTLTAATQEQTVQENPHKLWKQLLGLAIATIIIALAVGNIAVALLVLLLGIFTFTDAWVSGIYKDAGKKAFLNISPMAWGIVMEGLLILAYPLYLFNRNKLRTRDATNVFWVLTIIVGAIGLLGVLLSVVGMLFTGSVLPKAELDKPGDLVSFTISDLRERYDIDDDGYYYLAETYDLTETRMIIDGEEAFAEKEIDTELPDRAKGEYERLRVLWSPSGDTYIRTEAHLLTDEAQFVTLEFEAQVEFIKGNRASFAAGNDVTVRYTEAGLKRYVSYLQQQLQDSLCGEFGVSPSADETCTVSFERFPNEIMAINRNTIYLTADGPAKMVMEF